MKDIIVKIMVEVLTILGTLTKEIGQGRMSTFFQVDLSAKSDYDAEKLLKGLAGKGDVKEALDRLDKLTEEETRIAAAEIWKNANRTHDRLKDVDEKVEGVDEKIRSVNIKVEVLDVEAQGVGDKVQDINDKVISADEGEVYRLTQPIIS
jgi:phosphoribosylformylglycinamidine (FGAM) synthase PurS component